MKHGETSMRMGAVSSNDFDPSNAARRMLDGKDMSAEADRSESVMQAEPSSAAAGKGLSKGT
jgi:hypothetical protein